MNVGELLKLIRWIAKESTLRLIELNSDGLNSYLPRKPLLEACLAVYADPDDGSTWEEVVGRIRAHLSRGDFWINGRKLIIAK